MRIRLWLTLIIALNATFFQSAPALSQGKRVALVIGNSAYENTPPLADERTMPMTWLPPFKPWDLR